MAKKSKAQDVVPSEVEIAKESIVPVVEEIAQEVIPAPIELVEIQEKVEPVKSVEKPATKPAQVISKEIPSMAFDVMGESFPWAWNMSNINNKYWFSCIDSAQYADLKSERDSEFKSFVRGLIEKTGMTVVVREPRNSMFVHIDGTEITESTVIYL